MRTRRLMPFTGLSNLLAQTRLDEEQAGYVYSIKQSSEVLLGIINDILQVATIQNNKDTSREKKLSSCPPPP